MRGAGVHQRIRRGANGRGGGQPRAAQGRQDARYRSQGHAAGHHAFIHVRPPRSPDESIGLAIASSEDRSFTVNGAIPPATAPFFFFLPPDLSKLEKHVIANNFFMLYGSRGAGKTTAALQLLQRTEAKYGVRPLKLDFNSITVGTTRDAFWRSVFRKLHGEAERHNITMQPFDDVAGFVDVFTLKSMGGARVILMLDEFDKLEHAAAGIKEEFLGAVRTIKLDLSSYGVQCIFAVGPFSIVFMRGDSGSPFNVREAVPVHFFTQDQVAELLGQFTTAKVIALEEGVVADIHELTAGHAGLVCACGQALESGGSGLQQNGHVTLAAWKDYRVRHIIDSVLKWPTIGDMADSVSKMIDPARQLLERALIAGDAPLQLATAPADASAAARYLAAEGWFIAHGEIGTDTYRFTSPLVRSLAMRQLAKQRGWELHEPLPFVGTTEDRLDVPAALCAALPYFRPTTMRSVPNFSTKTSTAPASVFKLPRGKRVPTEAVYHFEMFSVLRQWLGFWQHADLYPEADVARSVAAGEPKRYADMLIGPSWSGSPKHILELVASSDAADIQDHYSRTIKYMASHGTSQGACITFTAVTSDSPVSVPETSLEWPAASQLCSGLVAVHVVHDLKWTTANVYWKSATGKGTSTVKLGGKLKH